ncbi:hypothetical protein LTR05_001588 [Lithohypha guttulata]|uniref:Uncharacterized protein n=1 Tax=Lithohypha guttulata TaxID=1690604 RepID=A0AAN7T7Z8_9EURO|nr:hypothetical protein LTR05_001588 [Lithohypha guttulata]
MDSQDGNGCNDAVLAGSRNTDWHVPAWRSRPSPEIAVDVVSVFETRETLATVYTCLASSIAPSKQLAFTVDALSSLPALVLDYLRQCEQSSLGRIKSIATTPETRQTYFQKNKILRDLYADVESRILNLAGQRAEQLAGRDGRDGRDGSVEVSSHVLWDLEAPI